MTLQLNRRLIKVEEYHRMAEAGILQEKGLELIHGEMIKMNPIGSRHSAVVKRLNKLLHQMLGEKFLISVQDPVLLDDFTEPEPDIAILHFWEDYYADRHPRASETLLIIEVADSSLSYDKEIKLPLYASSGIPECWIVNLEAQMVEAYRQPVGSVYKLREIAQEQDMVKSQGLNFSIALTAIFG
ncbi:MAG: Uma2 family endonuclease [Bacteroidia bacterium]|nr:Uma2 family endonuclease [Bacteroidia bacterium]